MPCTRRSTRHLLADQRGQDTVEYIGVLAILAALIGVVLLAVNTLGPAIEHGAECLIAKVFHLSICTSAAPAYPVSSSTKDVGYNARVVIVNGGHSYTVKLTKLSNGTSTITVVDNGMLGVSAQWGANIELGPAGGAGADATIGGGVYGGNSSTWTFPSWSGGQRYFDQISQGSALGLTAHDLVSGSVGQLPGVGSWATGLFDSITGASGAPNQGSIPHKFLSSTSTGGGVQGGADAGAHADFGPLQAGVNASLEANGGLYHINYGAEKGDWQLVAGLDGTADGELANWLFGAQASGLGTINGEVSVIFSPSGAPQTLEVGASGDGVWGIAPPSAANLEVPGGSSKESGSAKESGSSKESGTSTESGGGKEPVLSLDSNTAGGSGVGSMFTGTLDLSNDPQAAQDVTAILEGNPSGLGDLISQMNAHGTETLQSYRITRSNSTVGAGLSFGAGAGGSLSDGSANATYNRPESRQDGGKWHSGS